VAAGPEDPAATGALEELLVVVEDVLRDPALHLLPGDGGQPVVAAAAAAQGLELPGRDWQGRQYFPELSLGVGGRDKQQVRPV